MTDELRWVKPSIPLLDALANQDLERASKWVDVALDPFLIAEDVVWLWRLRLEQAYQDARTVDWIAQLVVCRGQIVGHAGFHGPPDEFGMVEVAYYVLPACRGRGLAKKMLHHLLQWADSDPEVRSIRASCRPDNVASLAVIRSFPFEQVGEQWDDTDGLEVVFDIRKRNE